MHYIKINKQILAGFHRNTRSKRNQLLYLCKREIPIWALTLGLCLLFLSGCGGQSNAQTANPTIIQTTLPTIEITESQNGQSMQAHVSNTIVLQLAENPSTGYLWAVSETDSTILALQDSTYTASKASPGIVGSGGTRTLTFLAKKSGTAHLQLKYWRSFEGDSSIIKRFSVTINVSA